MASGRERRKDKARKRHKARRAQAQKARAKRTARGRAGVRSAATWPIDAAWISRSWHEPGAHVHGVLVRAHADGTQAWAAFEVDLADEGLVDCDHAVGVSEGHVQQALMERSDETDPLISVEPALLAKLAHEGAEWSRKAGLSMPRDLGDALTLLGDVDAADSPYDLVFGAPEDHEPTEPPDRPGLFARLLGRG